MNKRKIALILLVALLVTTLFSGCADTNDPVAPTGKPVATGSPTGDPTEGPVLTDEPAGENETSTPEVTASSEETPTPETVTDTPEDTEDPATPLGTEEPATDTPDDTAAAATDTPTPTPTSGGKPTPTPTPTPSPTPTPEPTPSDNVFDYWDSSLKAIIGKQKQNKASITEEGLRLDYDDSSGSGDPYMIFNVAKYSSLTGKKALGGKDGSYIVFKVRSELGDGDFELFTQTPQAGDSAKSAYVQNGHWQYLICDMTGTTLVNQAKLSTIRIDWGSIYTKKNAWMIISEIAFFADKKEAYDYAGIPLDPGSESSMKCSVSFPSSGNVDELVVLDNGTATLKKDGGLNAVEIVSGSASQTVTLNLRESAALQNGYAAQKRYLAIKMKTSGNVSCAVNLRDYSDLCGQTVKVDSKGSLAADDSGWQGVFFDLKGYRSSHESIMKITLQLSELTGQTGKVLIGDIIVSDNINDVLDACGLSSYKLDTSGVSYNDPLASSKLTAPNEDAGFLAWFDQSTEKVVQNVVKPTGLSGYTINMAKNESENAQFFVAPSKNMKINVTVDDFSDGNGHKLTPELSYEYYHNLANVMRPDALIPMSEPIDVKAGNSQAFMIRVTTTADTPAGTYNSIVHVFDANTGKEIKRAAIAVKVWNFTLSDETALRTAFALWDISNGYPAGGEGYDGSEWDNVIYNYYEFFFKYRINIMDIYSGITSGRGIAYMQNPRLNTARWSVNSYSAWQDLQNDGYTEKPMWLSKIIYYPGECDEPRTESQFKQLKAVAGQIAEHDPEYRMVIPVERDLELNADGSFTNINSSAYDSVGFLMKYTNIYCPKLDAFTPRELSGRGGTSFLQSIAQDKKYGSFMDRMREGVKNGGELWSYVCINPTQPYCNWQIPSDGTEAIVSIWQMKQLGVTGMLYWNVDYWKVNYWNTSEPWSTVTTAGVGDGILIYSGHIIHSLYPIPTMRLESIRDGIEDYQMLTMLEEKLGSEALANMLKKVCTSVVTYTDNDDYLHAVRVRLYETLEQAYR